MSKKKERRECTEEDPYFITSNERWFHPKAVEVSNEIYTIWYRCPICGLLFGETQPDY